MSSPEGSVQQIGSPKWRYIALVWWFSIMAFVPVGRPVVDVLRSRGLLAVSVTSVMALLVVAAWLLLRRAQKSGALHPRQTLLILGACALALALAQLMPRAEERWHVVQYGLLGALLSLAAGLGGIRRLGLAGVLVVVAGWLDEGFQFFLPDRVYDNWDVLVNGVSGVVGVCVAHLSARLGGRS